MRLFLLLFVIIPLLEIFLLIKIGSHLGALTTIAWLVLAGVLGIALLRMQGVLTLMQVRESMARGEASGAALGSGVLLALAGILLIIPGFASDLVAFILLIPGIRSLLVRRWSSRIHTRSYHRGPVYDVDVEPGHSKPTSLNPPLEGDYKREE